MYLNKERHTRKITHCVHGTAYRNGVLNLIEKRTTEINECEVVFSVS